MTAGDLISRDGCPQCSCSVVRVSSDADTDASQYECAEGHVWHEAECLYCGWKEVYHKGNSFRGKHLTSAKKALAGHSGHCDADKFLYRCTQCEDHEMVLSPHMIENGGYRLDEGEYCCNCEKLCSFDKIEELK